MRKNRDRQRLFDQWSAHYDRDVLDGRFPFIGYDRTLEILVESGAFLASHKVLDVGIGTGNLAARMQLPNEQIWGIDFSKEMLGKAANSLPGSHLFQVDLLAQNWPRAIKQPFDRIVSGYTLHEFPEEKKRMILRRLASECLAPDGMILIADISFADLVTMREVQDRFISEGSWDEEEFYGCAEILLPKLEDEGFKVDYIQTSPCAGIYRLSRN